MLQNLFNYIDSGALDWVLWVAIPVFVLAEVAGRVRRRNRRQMANWALAQWLAGENNILILIEKDQKMSQERKIELKDLILPLAVFLIILAAVYCSHWYMAWPIWATAIGSYLVLYGGVIVAVLATRRIFPRASKALTIP